DPTDEAAVTPSKSRSFSDPPSAQLAPSPTFRERVRQGSKDDHALPRTPAGQGHSSGFHRPEFVARGLSLQMPHMPSPAHFNRTAAPLSPKLDERDVFVQNQDLSASPATSLPRHSRGLDFARACTNLHHTTIAEQSSPDSSPVITQRGMAIPYRKGSVSSMMLDSPAFGGSAGATWGAPITQERSVVSSSVGSVNMMASDSEGTDSDGDASMGGDDQEDPIYTTPQVHKLQNPNAPTPFQPGPQTPGGGMWGNSNFSPAQASLMKTMRRTRLHKSSRKSRKSSSSASNSGYSSLASPRTTSPPPMRSIESAATTPGGGYFAWQANATRSRRESLALGTEGIHLSSGNDSGDEASLTAPSTPGVVRRPVTRRGNLLPKTKGFARIRAALAEEAAPEVTEIRRESETIRQVRERDNSVVDLDLTHEVRPGTAESSPNLLPAVPESAQEDFGQELDGDNTGNQKGLGMNFASHASRNSGGLDYWNRFDPAMRTPPPPTFNRQSSSMMSDFNMDSPNPNAPSGILNGSDAFWRRPRARSSASDASDAFTAPTLSNTTTAANTINDDVALKKFKRRREDDFDIATIKRRAVSPGMSAQNSPVLMHSPSQREGSFGGAWGQPPEKKRDGGQLSSAGSDSNGHPPLQTVRSNSGGSVVNGMTPNGGLPVQGKKLGLQGMVDTNDGLMKMSI
ncbi:hypothetical protein BAUCODRAFT_42534, partial [Baudoinia panamericana UAMH 10762]